MSALKICGAVGIFLIFSLCFFRSKGSIGAFVGLGLCLMIVLSGIENLIPVFDYFNELARDHHELGKYLPVLLKTLGVGLICSALSGICRENGEGTIGACVDFFARGEILILAMPIVKDLLMLVVGE